uniref:Uncharacterized protein n=1 Tax=Parascaris univalens TaxID=6257 RepID=A0A915ASF4_PARUN
MAQQAIVNAQLCIVFTAIHACLAYSTVDLFDSYFRLPQHFNPIIYDLKLTLSPKKETIWGQHATIENRLTNETIDLGIPNVDWNRYLIAFNSNSTFDSGSVYYLSVWYQTTYADSHGGLIKYEDKCKASSTMGRELNEFANGYLNIKDFEQADALSH